MVARQSNRRWWPLAAASLFCAAPAAAQSSFAHGTRLGWPGVLTGAFLGFLLLPVAYNIAFFLILRERFLIWQGARVLLLVALTVSLSSLPLGPWFGGESFARQALAVAVTSPAMLLHPCPPLYMALRNVVLVGVLVLMVATLILAIRRGSRAARFQLAAWSCLLTVCGISLYHDIVLHRPFGLFLYVLFAALALENAAHLDRDRRSLHAAEATA